MIRAVIFDMDGVIVDTEEATAQATIDMFDKLYGAKVKKEDFLPFVGMGAKKYIMGVAEKYKVSVNRNAVPITPQSIGKISKKFFRCLTLRGSSRKETPCFSTGRFNLEKAMQLREENFSKSAAKGEIKPFPGVIELIKEAKNLGIKTAIATSSHRIILEITLKGAGIDIKNFDAITTAEECKNVKPDPEIFLLTAKKLNIPPKDCLVIEDSPAGIKAGKTGGFLVAAVTNTFPKSKLQEADFVVKNLQEISLKYIKSKLY